MRMLHCWGYSLWLLEIIGKRWRKSSLTSHSAQNTTMLSIIPNSLAWRHHLMMPFSPSAPLFFKPHHQTSSVPSVMIFTLPDIANAYIAQKTDSNMIYSTSRITIDGTDHAAGMFVCLWSSGMSRNAAHHWSYLIASISKYYCLSFRRNKHKRGFLVPVKQICASLVGCLGGVLVCSSFSSVIFLGCLG